MGKIRIQPINESEAVKETHSLEKEEGMNKKVSPTKSNVHAKKRSVAYKKSAQAIDKNKLYSIDDAVNGLQSLVTKKFDETVELHINTIEKGIYGEIDLPHGNGKKVRIAVLNPSESQEETTNIIKKISEGIIDFDVLIATPDAMPQLAKVARVLGPKGLMPNPKNGTITSKPSELIKKYNSGHISFKTESKSPIIHMNIGKISFDSKALSENALSAINAIQIKNIKSAFMKTTMSPSVRLDLTQIK